MKVGRRSSSGTHQGERGLVIALRGFTSEIADRAEDEVAKSLGATDRSALKEIIDAFQAEFLGGMPVKVLALDYSAGNQQQRSAFFQAYGWSFGGGVREKPKRQASRTDLDNSTAITQKTRRMSGVGVAESSELLVVTANEGWTRVDAMGGVDESPIEAKTQFCHGLGFVDIGARKKLSSKVAKDLLCGCEDGEVIFPTSSNIEQAKQDPLGTYTERIIEVPSDALAQEVGRDICSLNLGKWRLNRLDRDCIGGNAGTKERAHASGQSRT